jgi:hypothetical protein
MDHQGMVKKLILKSYTLNLTKSKTSIVFILVIRIYNLFGY